MDSIGMNCRSFWTASQPKGFLTALSVTFVGSETDFGTGCRRRVRQSKSRVFAVCSESSSARREAGDESG